MKNEIQERLEDEAKQGINLIASKIFVEILEPLLELIGLIPYHIKKCRVEAKEKKISDIRAYRSRLTSQLQEKEYGIILHLHTMAINLWTDSRWNL